MNRKDDGTRECLIGILCLLGGLFVICLILQSLL